MDCVLVLCAQYDWPDSCSLPEPCGPQVYYQTARQCRVQGPVVRSLLSRVCICSKVYFTLACPAYLQDGSAVQDFNHALVHPARPETLRAMRATASASGLIARFELSLEVQYVPARGGSHCRVLIRLCSYLPKQLACSRNDDLVNQVVKLTCPGLLLWLSAGLLSGLLSKSANPMP